MVVVARTPVRPRRNKCRGRHPDKALSAAFVRSAPPGRHADGNGLYLFVQPTGTRSWVQRLVIRGRRRELGLGAAALVPLAEARELALANRKLARSGGDPLSEKRRADGVPTFTEAAERVLEQKRGGWRGRWHAQNWWKSMERYAFPRIGRRAVSEVNTADVLEIQRLVICGRGRELGLGTDGARLARPSARAGLRQPQAGVARRRPSRRQAPRPGCLPSPRSLDTVTVVEQMLAGWRSPRPSGWCSCS